MDGSRSGPLSCNNPLRPPLPPSTPQWLSPRCLLGPGPLFSLSFSTLTDRPALSDFSTLTLTLGQSVKIHFSPWSVPLHCWATPSRPSLSSTSKSRQPTLSLVLSARLLSSTLQPHSLLDYLPSARNLERVEVNRVFSLVTERTDSHRLRVVFPPTDLRSPNPTDRPVLLLGHYPECSSPFGIRD